MTEPVLDQPRVVADKRRFVSGYVFLLFSRGNVGMHLAIWCYAGRGQTIEFGGSVEPDLGQSQVARTDSAVVRFACPLEAFFGHGPILGGRFHIGDASYAHFTSEKCISRARQPKAIH